MYCLYLLKGPKHMAIIINIVCTSHVVIKKTVGVNESCSTHRQHKLYTIFTDFSYKQLGMNTEYNAQLAC